MNRKGFTLIELIIVICIIGVLAVVLMPICFKYVGIAKENVCRSNITEMNNIFRIHQITDPDCTLEDIFGGKCSELSDSFSKYECPSGGKYYIKSGKICCKIHDDESGEETGEVLPGTGISLTGNGWPTEEMFDKSGNYSFTAGEIFKYGESYYVITKDFVIYKSNTVNGPENIISWDFFEKFTDVVWDSSEPLNGGKLQPVSAGDIYKADNGNIYVYTPNSGGWGPMPPEKHPNAWFKVPTK